MSELKLPLPQCLHEIGKKWIDYAQEDCDPNDIAYAIWSALNEAAQPVSVQAEPVQRHTIKELLALYDTHNGDWCKVARAVEDRFAAPPVADSQDAARYRFIRDQFSPVSVSICGLDEGLAGDALDVEIDAAMGMGVQEGSKG